MRKKSNDDENNSNPRNAAKPSQTRRTKNTQQVQNSAITISPSPWKSIERSSKIYVNAPPNDNVNCAYDADSTTDIDIIPGIGACMVGTLPAKRVETLGLRQRLAARSTDWVTATLLDDPNDMREYVQEFVKHYERYVGSYLEGHGLRDSVYLVYKGGNVIVDYIRALALSSDESAMLVSFSDIDFQVFVTNDDVYERHGPRLLRLIAHAALKFKDYIRTFIEHNNNNLLNEADLPDYSDVFEAERKNIQPMRSYLGAERAVRHDAFILRKDSTLWPEIDKENRRNNKLAKCQSIVVRTESLLENVPNTAVDNIYMTFNDSLRFQMKGVDGVASYDLVRIKYNIDISLPGNVCPVHAPGELLDVSISTPNDFKMIFARNNDINKWTIIRSDGVRIPSLDYLANHDLHGILFEENVFPWADTKYKKRLFRYVMCLALLDAGADKVPNKFLQNYASAPHALEWTAESAAAQSTLDSAIQKVVNAMMKDTIGKLNAMGYWLNELQSWRNNTSTYNNAKNNAFNVNNSNNKYEVFNEAEVIQPTFQLFKDIKGVMNKLKAQKEEHPDPNTVRRLEAEFSNFLVDCLDVVAKTGFAMGAFADKFMLKKFGQKTWTNNTGNNANANPWYYNANPNAFIVKNNANKNKAGGGRRKAKKV